MITTHTSVKPLGAYLIEAGLLTPERLEIALEEQKETQDPLGKLLSRHGWISQQTIEYMVDTVVIPKRQEPQNTQRASPMDLIKMFTGPWVAQALYVAASLNIADLLKDKAQSIAQLAQATNADPDNLYRVMRALASVGVFNEIAPGQFALTEIAQYLRSDRPNSLHSLTKMLGDQWHWQAWSEVLHVVKTGQPAMKKLYGVDDTFDYLEQNQESGSLFNDAMTNFAKNIHSAVIDAYDFSGIKQIVDIAGGHGALISSILKANPQMQGILFDLPHVVTGAHSLLTTAGVSDRCQLWDGDFFQTVPPGGDAYILSYIIHDWNDADCLKILRNIRQAIAHNGKLLVVEGVVPTGNEPHFTKLMDLEMMIVYPNGKERTAAEYRELYQAAGFELTRIIPTTAPVSVLEGVCI